MFNPFLPEPQEETAVVSNPFLNFDVPANENPFLNSNPAPGYAGGNPFADFIAPPVVNTQNNYSNWDEAKNNDYMSWENNEGHDHEVSSATQNLLSTVTGALEATSDSLLDRLRINQPSPVPVSPMPSPRSPSPDLLMGDEEIINNPTNLFSQNAQNNAINDLMMTPLNNLNNSNNTTTTIDLLGLYNSPTPQDNKLQQEKLIEKEETASESLQHMFTDSQHKIYGQPVEETNIFTNTAPPQDMFQSLSFQQPSIQQNISEIYDLKLTPLLSKPVEIVEKMTIIEDNIKINKEEEKIPEIKQNEPQILHQAPPARLSSQPIKPTPNRPPPPVPPAPKIMNQQKIFEVQPQDQIKMDVEPIAKFPEPQKPPHPEPPKMKENKPPPPPPSPRIPDSSHNATTNVISDSSHKNTPTNIFGDSSNSNASTNIFGDSSPKSAKTNIFGDSSLKSAPTNIFAPNSETNVKMQVVPPQPPAPRKQEQMKEFDAFEDRFNKIDSDANSTSDAFGSTEYNKPNINLAWGDSGFDGNDTSVGFGTDDKFDAFLALSEPPPLPQSTPAKSRNESSSNEHERSDSNISIVIRAKEKSEFNLDLAPSLAPPPKSPAISTYSEENSSFVPFLSSIKSSNDKNEPTRTDSLDSPQTPLFEEDQSVPLEDFPRIKFIGDGWEMHMRHPNKKKITGQRFWKKVYVRIVIHNDIPTVNIYNTSKDKDPIQEIPLQPCYSISDIAAQQFDQYGKIFTAKIQFVFYKERPGVRPGQITKAERITTKLSQFAAYAIQGDYQGVKEFGSDLKKLGMPIEHAPQISQLVKLGTQNFEEMKQFSAVIEESLFKLHVSRDRALNYKSEEVQVTLVDEYYIEQDKMGVITKQIARVRLHFLSFLSGAAEVELGINDIRRQGKEVVGRHDIIPIATEEWIRIEDIEFSSCVQLDVFENTKMVKFKPPDACYIELLRFRVRPPRHRELPMQVKTTFITTGHRIEIRCDILVPGFTSRKLGQIPCEDVMVRIPIPETWIYMFRVEKHFRYGSVKSAHRRSGKVKGIERFLGAVEAVEQSLMEVTSGQAKYEHQHKSIVWRIARLPKEGQGAYTTHSFFCHITLQQHEEIPENLTKFCYVEFTMPHTTISHTVCRSVSVPNCDEPPEKCVKYLSRHEYVVEIEHAQGVAPATYNLAASVTKEEPVAITSAEEPMEGKALSDSDFSDD